MRVASLSLTLSLALAATVSADTIKLVDGSSIEDVRIKAVNIQTVSFREGARSRDIPTWKVEKIIPTDPPRLYKQAMDAAGNNEIDRAIGAYQNYIDRTKPTQSHAWLIQFAFWERAKLVRETGGAKGFGEWLAEMDALIKKVPDTMFLIHDYRTRRDYFLNKGDKKSLGNAIKRADKWLAVVKKMNLSKSYLYEAELDKIMVQRDGLQTLTADKAVARLESIVKGATGLPMALNRARCEMGQSLALMKKHDEAAKYFEEVTKADMVDNLSLARAWLGMGRSLANKAKAKEEFKEAAICFLRVYEVFKRPAKDDGLLREVVGWALYYAESAIKGWEPDQVKEMVDKLHRIRRGLYRTTAAGRKR